MRAKRWLALGLALVMMFALTGCNKTPAAQGEQPSPSGGDLGAAGEDDGNFVVSMVREPGSIDPTAVANMDEMEVLGHLFEGLMKWEGSGREAAPGIQTAKAVPGMAERYDKTLGDDGSATYTFHLRQAKWSDGKAVTAHDFVYAWQRLVNPSNGADYAELLADCVAGGYDVLDGYAQLSDLGVRAVDDATLEVELVQDGAWFLELCALPVTAPLRQDAIEGSESGWTTSGESYLTNGPYRLMAWENAYMAMEKNEDYYEKVDGPDTLIFVFGGGSDDLTAFEAGSLDFLQGADPAQAKAGQVPYLASYYLTFQTQRAPFDNALVRQAFALAVDRETLTKKQAVGQTPAGGLVPKGIYGSDGAAGADFRTRAGDYLDPSAKAYANNCKKAKELLSQAGYPGGEGFPKVSYLCPENAAHQAVGQALCAMWKEALGVEVTVETVGWGDFLGRSHRGEFDMARGRWVADYNDPTAFLSMWHSESVANDAQYQAEAFDELLDKAYETADPSARMDLLVQAEGRLIGQDWVLAPLYYETQTYLRQEAVKGVCYTSLGYFIFTQAKK